MPPRGLFALALLAYMACWGAFFWVSSRSRREQTIRFVIFNMSLILAVGIVEASALLGAIDYRDVFQRPAVPWEKTSNVLDRQLVHIRRPRLRIRQTMHGGDLVVWAGAEPKTIRQLDVRYDHNGFRNENEYEEADCIVIGDSFIEGMQVRWEELHTTQIAESLGMTVVNLGQSGYGPQQELIVLRRFGVPLRPRICLWVFFEGNDLSDVRQYQELVEGWPESVANYDSLKERSFTKNLFWWLSARFEPRDSRDVLSRSGLLASNATPTRLWFGYAGRDLTPSDDVAIRTTVASIADAHALCEQEGIEFAVVFAPIKFRVYGDLCHFEDASLVRRWTCNDLPRRLGEHVSKISDQIGFLDLTPEFKKAAQDGNLLYFADDSHWSPDGHGLAARSICTFLRNRLGDSMAGKGD